MWNSLTEASDTLKISITQISHCCNGRITAHGFKWAYVNNFSKELLVKNLKNKGNKPIYQINKDTNEILRTWNSLTEAARFFNISISSISKCCRKRTVTCGGYKWSYVDEVINN